MVEFGKAELCFSFRKAAEFILFWRVFLRSAGYFSPSWVGELGSRVESVQKLESEIFYSNYGLLALNPIQPLDC